MSIVDRVIAHSDAVPLEGISDYEFVLRVDFEIHTWLKEQEEEVAGDMLKWLQQNKGRK